MNKLQEQRWHEIERIFAAAVEHDTTARAAFVQAVCAGDEALRCEVERLLAADQKAQQLGPGFLASPLRSARDIKLGAYQLRHEIARGGMGTVWLAERADEQFQQQVAIKVMHAGGSSEELQRRFQHERQILADLNHPNIARLLDGGTTEDGRPYFVMEYIEGLPLDEYCHQQQLAIRARLQLFRQVCAAVQYAHQHLIIHRDLKPANILVTTDGTPKLLDFGVAKLLQPDLTASHHTGNGLTPMTPAYASPEQMCGKQLTTTSDVYSLGVVLYELLTGRSPYQLKENTFGELSRAICEQEPTAPSRSQKSEAGSLKSEEKAAADFLPRSSFQLPASSLRGDLDSIVLMALRKEPSARYSSVEQFSTDIQRYLDGLPTLARKGTFAYRAMKYVRRYKVPVAAAALIVLSLLSGIGATSRQAQIAHAAQAKAEAQRMRAEQALAVADAQRRRAEQALAAVEAQRSRAENALTTAEQRRQQAEAARTEANQQRAVADTQRLAAEAERNIAQTQRQRAETQELSNRQLLYTSRMGLAHQAWENSNLGRMRELLNYYLPQSGEPDFRSFEWNYLWGLAHDVREQKVLPLAGKIKSTLFSRDGRRLFTLSQVGKTPVFTTEIHMFDTTTWQEARLYNQPSAFVSVSLSLSPDGEKLAVNLRPGEIKILSARTGAELRTLLVPMQEAAKCLAFSPDGKILAVGFYSGAIRLLEEASGRELRTIRAHLQQVNHVTFSPDGQKLLSGSHDRSLRLWDVSLGQELFTYWDGVKEASRSLTSLFTTDGKNIIVAGSGNLTVTDVMTNQQQFFLASAGEKIMLSPDGKVLAIGGQDAKNNNVISLYDTTTWKQIDTIKAHEQMITALAFAPDGTHLVSGGEDQTVRYWKVDKALPQQVVGDYNYARGSIFQTALVPDGTRLLAGETGQKAAVWDLTTGKLLMKLDGHNDDRKVNGFKFNVAASPDGRLFATAGKDCQLKFWDANDGKELRSIQLSAQAEALGFSPDSRLLAFRSGQNFSLLEVASGNILKTWEGHWTGITPLVFSRDGKRLWSAGNDGTVRVWEVSSGQALRSFNCSEASVHQVVLSPDERFFATASDDGIAKIWGVQSGNEVRVFKGHSAYLAAVAFSPDGKRLVTGSGDRLVKLWDIATGQELLVLKDHQLDISHGAIHFTPDGKTLVTADWARQIWLWHRADEVSTGAQPEATYPKFLSDDERAFPARLGCAPATTKRGADLASNIARNPFAPPLHHLATTVQCRDSPKPESTVAATQSHDQNPPSPR